MAKANDFKFCTLSLKWAWSRSREQYWILGPQCSLQNDWSYSSNFVHM